MTVPERAAQRPPGPLAACEGKRDEAYRLALDGMGIVHIPGTEAIALIDPQTDERITYFILHWPSLDTVAATPLRFWIKRLSHGLRDRNIVSTDYIVSEADTLKEITDFSAYAPEPTGRETFDPGIVDLARLPADLEDHLFSRKLEPPELADLLEQINRSIPADH